MSILDELHINLDDLNDSAVDSLGMNLYREEFFSEKFVGVLDLHDGKKVVFFEDRYTHAFHTSEDRIRKPYGKSKVAKERIARIKWIKPILKGEINGTECWQIWGHDNRQRLYIVYNERYVIWLESRKDGNWKFSSAYVTGESDIKRYKAKGQKIWEIKNAP